MKYELVRDMSITVGGRILFRIRAKNTIKNVVEAGDLGGYIESESNLYQNGNAWVSDNAQVYGQV